MFYESEATIVKSTFQYNAADGYGGAIAVAVFSELSLNSTNFIGKYTTSSRQPYPPVCC